LAVVRQKLNLQQQQERDRRYDQRDPENCREKPAEGPIAVFLWCSEELYEDVAREPPPQNGLVFQNLFAQRFIEQCYSTRDQDEMHERIGVDY